jgi:fatty-acyl-CoA synthase
VRVLDAPNAFARRVLEIGAAASSRPFLTLLAADGTAAALTYGELLESAGRWCQRYRERGLLAGGRIVVILEHGEPLYASWVGALLGGYVPAYFAPPSPKIDETRFCAMVDALLDRVGGDFVVTSDAIAGRLGEKLKLPGGLLQDGRALEPRRPLRNVGQPLGVDALFLQFSSGTTGLKKGVAVSADAALWQVDAYARSLRLGKEDVIASWLPLYHDMGLVACLLLPLAHGVPVVAMSPFDWIARPEMLLDAVARHRATLAWLPNFAYSFLAARVADKRWDLASLRALVNCSEPVLERSHRSFLDRFGSMGIKAGTLGTCYAMAETTFAITASAPGEAPATDTFEGRAVVSSGRALPETGIRILDEQGKELPESRLGEIAVSSRSLFSGYVGDREATRASLSNGWFRTGDLGYLRAGELFVVGRSKDTLIVGGRNLFPQDIEAVVSGVQGVVAGRCVAAGIDDPALGTQSILVIAETRETQPERRADLTRRIHTAVAGELDVSLGEVALAEHMWLVKSTSGKLARAENRDRYLKGKNEPRTLAPAVAPEGVGAQVRACIAEALSIGAARVAPAFGDDEDLVKSGIVDSFALVSLQLALEARFGADRVRPIRERPDAYRSVRAFATALGEALPAKPAAPAAAAMVNGELPQMADVRAQPYQWVAYLMRRGAPNFRSRTLNSDEHGFRQTWREGSVFAFEAFRAHGGPKGVVLGNSFAYGIGTSHDAKTFTSLLNDSRFAWYNLAQRASVCMQERIAFELFGPERLDALAWVSGVNNLIGLIVGEGMPGNPAPFVGERQYAMRMMPGVQPGMLPPFEERYRTMLRQLEIDVSTLALRLRERTRLAFFLQPSATWIAKPFTSEERELIERFDAAGAVLQQAHHPRHLGPLHARFAADVAAICGRWQVHFVDSNADSRFRTQEWLFADRTHMVDGGHAVMAGLIRDWMNEGRA